LYTKEGAGPICICYYEQSYSLNGFSTRGIGWVISDFARHEKVYIKGILEMGFGKWSRE
jgi:hypothetical protein